MSIRIQLRGDTQTNWSTANPILAEREFGVETDTSLYKIGDGINNWNDLPYKGLDGTDGLNASFIPGTNISTGGTPTNTIVNVVDDPIFNSVSASTFFSGSTNLESVITSIASSISTPNDYTTSVDLSGNTLHFNRTDLNDAYSVDLTPIIPSGLTGNYLPISGGTLTGDLNIDADLSAHTLTLLNSGATTEDRYDISGNWIKTGVKNSSIIAGVDNTINNNLENVLIAGSGLTANNSNTAYFSNLNVKGITEGFVGVNSEGKFVSQNLPAQENDYTTGASYSAGVITFNRTDEINAYDVDISSVNTDNYTTAVTLSASTLYFDRTNGEDVYSVDISSVNTDNYTTGATLSNGVVTFNRTDNTNAYSVDLKPMLNIVLTGDTNFSAVHFQNPMIYNTPTSAGNTNITQNLSNGLLGMTQKIYHNHSTAPTVPSEWKLIGGEYVINELNIIYAEFVSASRVEYWIAQEQ